MSDSYSVRIELECNDSYHYLTGLRSTYGLHSPAHVTVILGVSPAELSVLKKHLAAAAGRISPFELSFGEIMLQPRRPPYSRPCVWIPVEGRYLERIYRELYPQSCWQRLFGTYRHYEPHVTIAYPSYNPHMVYDNLRATYRYRLNYGGQLRAKALGLQLWVRRGSRGPATLVEAFKFPRLFRNTINAFIHSCGVLVRRVAVTAPALFLLMILSGLLPIPTPSFLPSFLPRGDIAPATIDHDRMMQWFL